MKTPTAFDSSFGCNTEWFFIRYRLFKFEFLVISIQKCIHSKWLLYYNSNPENMSYGKLFFFNWFE